MTRLPENSIRLWQRATPAGRDLYPAFLGERISRTQNALWDRRVVTGPIAADAEQFLASWTQDDYSGGFGIKDANETSDTSRIAFGVIDGRRPKSMCLPPLTTLPGAPWTPEALGLDLFAWFKADAITGLADTDPVTQWDDSTSTNRHLVQATGGVQPTYDATDAAINNKPSVDFASASSQRLENDGTPDDFQYGDNPLAVYAVWFMANSNSQTLLHIESGGANDPKVQIDGSGNLSVSGSTAVTAAITKAAWRMTGATLDGANSFVVIDGNARTTGNGGSSSSDGSKATLGSDLGEASGFLNGSIAEVLVINETVTQAEEDQIFGYFAHKYGLAGSLPSNHPYKAHWPVTAAPGSGFGPFRPLGDVGTQFYGAWDDFGILGWDADGGASSSGAWHAVVNPYPADFVPLGEAVPFCGYLFVPGGVQGIAILSETGASTGTLTIIDFTSITGVRLGLHDSKLWAIDTSNELWQLTVAGAIAGPGTLGNWDQVEDGLGNDLILDTGLSPTALIDWVNPGQEESLWCITRAQGAYILNPDEPRWVKQKIKAGAHPDWGITADVFREGEDLFIAGGGLDLTRLTAASVEVPISGPSKDQGVPPEYQGTIVDLCSERSTMYALIAAGSSVAAGSPTLTWVLQQTRGEQGGSDGQFQSPGQVAVDSFGNVYVADTGNDRVQKFNSGGAHVSNIITGIPQPWGVAVDSSDNIYVSFRNAVSDYRVRKYSSAGVTQWTTSLLSTGVLFHVATDGTHVFVCVPVGDTILKRLCSTGAAVATFGAPGTGNGQFSDPHGIAVDSTHLYIADQQNDRVQKLLKSNGSYVAQWGSAGSDNGEFSDPFGVALDASGDVWVCDTGNNRLQRFSNTGTFQTKIAQSSPRGIGVTASDELWVSTGTHTLVEWDEESVSTPAVEGKAWLGAWTGTAWCALWETAAGVSIVPTWMHVTMKAPYALWWGDEDGNAYYQLLPPPFFNPAARVTLGEYPFAPTGWMETVRYDANMSGWDKMASHFFAMMDYAAPDVYVDISYRTDADQFDSGLLDPPYRAWKRVDHIGRTLCWFDDTEIDPITGAPYREGEPFQWVQFRYDFVRGDDIYESPIWMWHSLHHLSVPQDSATMPFKVYLKDAKTFNRSPEEMATTIREMERSRAMVHLQTQNPRPGHPEWQVFFRGRITQVKSEFYPGANNKLDEILVGTFVELEASSNLHTTLAADTPA